MDAVLVAEDVRRSYGDTVALDGVSLSIDGGEVLALVGPNGAGKTTLVRAVTGTTDAQGEVRLFGVPPTAVDRSRIGLLPQDFSPHARLTARELITYYAGLYDEARDVSDVLADVGMADAADTWYENLSGGQRRRTCVGVTLVNDPDLLILDEPTTGIDPAGRRALWNLLDGLAAEGVSILLTTHDMTEAERLADRVALLSAGSVVAIDTPDALIDEYGGDSTLTVTGDVPPSITGDLDYPSEVADGRLTVHGVAPEDVGSVAARLANAGVEYDGLSWSEPDLEDVYLELTGTAVQRDGRAVDGPGARRIELTGGDAR